MKPLAISVGDPVGIGPEVTIAALRSSLGDDAALVFGEGKVLRELADSAKISVSHEPRPGAIVIHDVGSVSEAVRKARAPHPESGRIQYRGLMEAAAAVMRGEARVLITGPTSKAAIEMSGTRFTGQTEALAEAADIARDAVTMLFIGPRLKVALVTTHLSVRDAAEAIDERRVVQTVRHLGEALGRLGLEGSIAVTGVNPHAGEGGLFGHEEQRVIAPALDSIRHEIALEGPLPAEAAFRGAKDGRYVGVVAMIHDQATIASKLLDWGDAVNTTWGLPFIRTSVDHGVAFDIAGRGVADPSGMVAALELGRKLSRSP